MLKILGIIFLVLILFIIFLPVILRLAAPFIIKRIMKKVIEENPTPFYNQYYETNENYPEDPETVEYEEIPPDKLT